MDDPSQVWALVAWCFFNGTVVLAVFGSVAVAEALPIVREWLRQRRPDDRPHQRDP